MKKIISVINPKGGVGKSSIASLLADGLHQSIGDVLCIDTDPQLSLMEHYKEAEFMVNAVSLASITSSLRILKEKFNIVIIDTPSGADKTLDLPRANIVAESDVVVIPIRPSSFDFKPTKRLVSVLQERWAITGDNKPIGIFVLNKCDPKKQKTIKFIDVLKSFDGFVVAETVFKDLETVPNRSEDGETILQDKKLSSLGKSFIKEIEGML